MILKVAFDIPGDKLFDYFAIDGTKLPEIGTRVVARLGASSRLGVVMAISKDSEVPVLKIRSIDKVLDNKQPFLSADIVNMINHVSNTSLLSINKLAFAALPTLARKGSKNIEITQKLNTRPALKLNNKLEINASQKRIADAIVKKSDKFVAHLVCGQPNSGKRNVMLSAIASTIAKDKTCMLLVPTLFLIRQWVADLENIIPGIRCCLLHSDFSDAERLKNWQQANSGVSHIVIGARSSVFAPMPELGLVCVANENDPMHRTEHGLIYSARDFAAHRARIAKCPVLMTSTYPSLELRVAVSAKQLNMNVLTASATSSNPEVRIVDISQRRLFGGVSIELENALRRGIQSSGLSVVLVNQRGRGGTVYCPECRSFLRCKNCNLPLSLDQPDECNCRRCGYKQPEPKSCVNCGGTRLNTIRPGSARIAETLKTRIPEANILRIDSDANLVDIQTKLKGGQVDIIVGTKLLLGLDLKPDTCAVTDADSILYSPNLRSSEMLLDTLSKLLSNTNSTNLIIQTRFAQHHVFKALKTGKYDSFATVELAERKAAGLPPFRRLAMVSITGTVQDDVNIAAGTVLYIARSFIPNNITVMELVNVPQKSGWKTQFLINAPKNKELVPALRSLQQKLEETQSLKSVKWNIELDPQTW